MWSGSEKVKTVINFTGRSWIRAFARFKSVVYVLVTGCRIFAGCQLLTSSLGGCLTGYSFITPGNSWGVPFSEEGPEFGRITGKSKEQCLSKNITAIVMPYRDMTLSAVWWPVSAAGSAHGGPEARDRLSALLGLACHMPGSVTPRPRAPWGAKGCYIIKNRWLLILSWTNVRHCVVSTYNT